MDLNIAQPNENDTGVDLRDLLIDAGRPSAYATAPDTLTDSDAPQARGPLYAHIDIPIHVDTHVDSHADVDPPTIPPSHGDSHADLHFDNAR
jgi:hypothetical protein